MNKKMETALFSGGNFWGMEFSFKRFSGVEETKVGYTGGHTTNPTYESVCSDTTGHAMTTKIIFDPKKIQYQRLVNYFFQASRPNIFKSAS